eukprot:10585956-Karenia_brevis.AAC.1
MEVKRAKMGQHRPKMSPRGSNPMEDFFHFGALWRTVGGPWKLRTSRIRRKKEKEEGGTRTQY